MLTTNVLFIDACPVCTVITYSTDWKQGTYTFTILYGVVICQKKRTFLLVKLICFKIIRTYSKRR